MDLPQSLMYARHEKHSDNREIAMYRDYPLQQHARHRAETVQPAFVHRAKLMLRKPDDCLLKESQCGLTLLARNEEALAGPISVLRQVFGAALQLSPLQVRLTGVPPHEPIMDVRINVPSSRIEPVKRVLRRRSIAILEESRGGTRCLLQGEAPLTQLLGLGVDLKHVTLGSSLLWTTLARYEPVVLDPEPIAA
jgi:Elongation factor G C-terminus